MRTSAGISFRRVALAALLAGALALLGCSSGRYAERSYKPSLEEEPTARVGIASWYGPDFHGKLTASGEPYDMYELTCAHKTFPLGTRLRVTNLENGKSVLVTVTDRGPFVGEREIDLSYAAAKKLDIIGPGTARVKIEPFGRDLRYVRYDKSYSIEKGPFTVQVGSFSDRLNALRVVKSLSDRYESRNPYVFEADTEGGRLYRVRIGKFSRREDAQSLAEDLLGDGYSVMVCPFEERI
jgi:rare lipoprotein A